MRNHWPYVPGACCAENATDDANGDLSLMEIGKDDGVV